MWNCARWVILAMDFVQLSIFIGQVGRVGGWRLAVCDQEIRLNSCLIGVKDQTPPLFSVKAIIPPYSCTTNKGSFAAIPSSRHEGGKSESLDGVFHLHIQLIYTQPGSRYRNVFKFLGRRNVARNLFDHPVFFFSVERWPAAFGRNDCG